MNQFSVHNASQMSVCSNHLGNGRNLSTQCSWHTNGTQIPWEWESASVAFLASQVTPVCSQL